MVRLTIAGGPSIEVAPGASILEALQASSHPISTSCGGVATCALCRVTITAGREHLSALNERELLHLGSIAKIVNLRLACQARFNGNGDVTIDVPPVEDVAAKKAAKAQRLRSAKPPTRR